MRSKSARSLSRFVFALLACASPSLAAQPYVQFVPWKILKPAQSPPSAPLILYWLPATREEMKKSELLTAHDLSTYAMQCVAMIVVRPDDAARIEKLAGEDDLPIAVLIDADGNEVARSTARHGSLAIDEVESMVGDELEEREIVADAMLDRARTLTSDGERDEAVALYRKVLEQRCTCPRQARDAQRALKKLGVHQ
ncbi:MAG TPA: hypothetical protein VMU84_08650 [Thermoanaerobaculia bacterium]|nr:hypothetical protein [Thermoanaerobaculia bacterium]